MYVLRTVPLYIAYPVTNLSHALIPLGALLVYLWLLWDPLRQGLHDKAVGTVVIGV